MPLFSGKRFEGGVQTTHHSQEISEKAGLTLCRFMAWGACFLDRKDDA